MHRVESRLFGITFPSDWSVPIKLRETCCSLIFRVSLVENRTDSSRPAGSLASNAWLSCRRLRLFKVVGFWSYDSATFNRNRDDEFSRRFLNWLLVTARRDCWRRLHEWLRRCCVRFVRIIRRLTWERIPAKKIGVVASQSTLIVIEAYLCELVVEVRWYAGGFWTCTACSLAWGSKLVERLCNVKDAYVVGGCSRIGALRKSGTWFCISLENLDDDASTYTIEKEIVEQ